MAEIQTETLPEFFNRAPFDMVRYIEYDEPGGTIAHGRFHTLTGGSAHNQMIPADADLFATLTRLCVVKRIDYGILHRCTLNSLGHRFFHDCRHWMTPVSARTRPWRTFCRSGGWRDMRGL